MQIYKKLKSKKVRSNLLTRFGINKATLLIYMVIIASIIVMLPTSIHADNSEAHSGEGSGNVVSNAIELDGEFKDWDGMPEITDRIGDNQPQSDIVSAKWFPDVNTSNLYLYCKRLDGTIDKNSNPKAVDWDFQVGFDSDSGKLIAFIEYHPESRQVDVNLTNATGKLLWSGKGKWGEDKYSADQVEFYIPLSYIAGSIQAGYQFEMSFLSIPDRVPDQGFITVSTASTIPWLTVSLLLLWIATLVFLHRQGMHFFKFIAGSVGLFIFVMLLGASVGERVLENAATWCMWLISQISGGFSVIQGYSLVTVLHGIQAVSFIIDYECSGFIELLVYLCLLAFYPMSGWRVKALYGAVGALFIFVANITRLLFISYSIKVFGTPVFFLSHTVFARILFFGMMVLLYYHVFTQPHILRQKVGDLSYD